MVRLWTHFAHHVCIIIHTVPYMSGDWWRKYPLAAFMETSGIIKVGRELPTQVQFDFSISCNQRTLFLQQKGLYCLLQACHQQQWQEPDCWTTSVFSLFIKSYWENSLLLLGFSTNQLWFLGVPFHMHRVPSFKPNCSSIWSTTLNRQHCIKKSFNREWQNL